MECKHYEIPCSSDLRTSNATPYDIHNDTREYAMTLLSPLTSAIEGSLSKPFSGIGRKNSIYLYITITIWNDYNKFSLKISDYLYIEIIYKYT